MKLRIGLGPGGPWCSLEAELPADLLEKRAELLAKVTEAFATLADAMEQQKLVLSIDPTPELGEPPPWVEDETPPAASPPPPARLPAPTAAAQAPSEAPLDPPRRREDLDRARAPARPKRNGQQQPPANFRDGAKPPRTGSEMLDWLKIQSKEVRKKAKALGEAWELGDPSAHWKTTAWSNDEVADVYAELTKGSQNGNGWGG